jgi:hypothetical protein
LSGQQTATNNSPAQPRAGQNGFNRIMRWFNHTHRTR